MKKTKLNRRQFVQGAALMAAPFILPSRLLGADAPSNRLTVGVIGCGTRFKAHVDSFSAIPGVRVVAVCDVWERRVTEGKARVDSLNGDTDCNIYSDYRELITDPSVDIVGIATPDHWHGSMAIEAAKHGKHIYLDKPFAYSIEEGRAIVEAVTRSGVILQHGTQQRSMSHFQRAAYLAQHGDLGDVHTVYAIAPPGPQGDDPTPVEPPSDLDYDFFTGPAPVTPFHATMMERRGTPGWYFMNNFCAGWVTAWGSHHVDSAQFALGKDREAPVRVEFEGSFPDAGACETPWEWYGEFTYADGKKLIYTTSNRPECPPVKGNVLAVGDQGWALASRRGSSANPPYLLEQPRRTSDPRFQLMDKGGQRDHFINFIDAIRYGTPLNAPMEVGNLSTTLCHLTTLGINIQRPFEWDGKVERIVKDDAANRLLGRPMRAPWKLS